MDHLNDLGEQAIKELSGTGGENLAAIERDVEQVKKSIQKSIIHQYTVLRLTIDGKRRAAWPQNASRNPPTRSNAFATSTSKSKTLRTSYRRRRRNWIR